MDRNQDVSVSAFIWSQHFELHAAIYIEYKYSHWCTSSQKIYSIFALSVLGPQCPLGTYVEQLSSGVLSCVTCPANSNSVETNSPECTCFNGYHRTNLEGPNTPCTCEWNNYYVAIYCFTVDCISLPWPCLHY